VLKRVRVWVSAHALGEEVDIPEYCFGEFLVELASGV
jgi:hypothetical protein